MKTGLVSISLRQVAPEGLVPAVSMCGLQGIEWGGDVHVPHGNLGRAAEVGRMTRDSGLEVASYGSYYRFEECNPGNSGSGPSMSEVIETAESLGAPAIRIWAGQAGPDSTQPEVWNNIVVRAREFAEAAQRRGIRVDFEYHENTLTETPESTLRLLQDIDHPNIHTLWQPPLQTLPEQRLEGLRQVKSHVTNVHCNYFGQNPWPDMLSLSEGNDEWALFLDELDPPTRNSWILIEHLKHHSLDQLQLDAEVLRTWLGLTEAVE